MTQGEAMLDSMNDRSEKILWAIMNEYIETGQPVGSRRITKKYDLHISPATVRNVMADLEEMELIEQPHTSAGRIPTDKGYRFYVDSLIKVRNLGKAERERIKRKFSISEPGVGGAVKETSRILSFLSQHTGVVLAPRLMTTTFRHIEFMNLGSNRILVILVTQSGIVQNKIILDECEFSQDQLKGMSNYLNTLLTGVSLGQVKEIILEEMSKEKVRYDTLLSKALALGREIMGEGVMDEVYIEGQSKVFGAPGFNDIEKMKAMFEAFEEKSVLIRLLDKATDADGIQIYIGTEIEIPEVKDCSLVASTYSKGSSLVGALGVIGPMRMDYSKIIPIVDYTAKLLNKIIEES